MNIPIKPVVLVLGFGEMYFWKNVTDSPGNTVTLVSRPGCVDDEAGLKNCQKKTHQHYTTPAPFSTRFASVTHLLLHLVFRQLDSFSFPRLPGKGDRTHSLHFSEEYFSECGCCHSFLWAICWNIYFFIPFDKLMQKKIFLIGIILGFLKWCVSHLIRHIHDEKQM